MDFSSALAYLDQVREAGTKLQLSNIQKIINNFPFDLNRIKFIQVAGTNGKGSTSHFISSILISNGHTTGLFTSPHLENIRERISINRKWISEKDFAHALDQVKNLTEQLASKKKIDNIPTYFEHLLLISLFHFFKNGTGYVVLEVGLGGRLDATSAITPELSVITNISKDHIKTLGRTIREIAFEKAGIIKAGVPVVTGVSPKSVAARTIKNIADKKNSKVYFTKNVIKEMVETSKDHYNVLCKIKREELSYKVFMNGKHQIDNAITATYATVILKNNGHDISIKGIESGIERTIVPGRVEKVLGTPGFIIDSGHNVASIRALRDFLFENNKRDLTLIFGVLGDKNYKKMVSCLLPFVSHVILTEPDSGRALPAKNLLCLFKNRETYVIKDYMKALNKARSLKKEILITGSFYLSGRMKNLLSGGN